mmetsp:Transcript_7952/g.9221  ORF Transcript_7952/g.9221 Transcript_7952/m.9221 type:complete len:466 (+) Transcript_7952:102-1499(+)|eukprot:CAMPEP_0197843258 /NCGR_PEP_ID=MMETSP1438-20131217/92_1 /TAXON_ID=1461541 /ORGANISM="Pterosperma sp., Strain CCMP1384" /LENGTH=465 /DNA_ID=CAMNT_0043453285 /DNA_START=102 /DNA_END=1499 /DNA_ORIENTATION=-
MAEEEPVVAPEADTPEVDPAPQVEPAVETVDAEAEPASEAVPDSDEGTLGKRKPDDQEYYGEPEAKRINTDNMAENAEEAGIPGEVAPEGEPSVLEPIAAAAVVVSDVTESVDCPPNMIGRLIGKNGETIKSLEAQCGARIQIDQQSKTCSITGTQQCVSKGVRLVTDLLNAPPDANVPAPEAQKILDCPPGLVGRIIGRGGETIKSLQAHSGATISIDQNFPNDVPRKVHISGSASAVAQGEKMVRDLLSGAPQQGFGGQGGYAQGSSYVLDCPKEMVGRVIGRGGETIKGIQHHSAARVQIDQSQNPCKVSIQGPQQAVDAATRMITDIINGGSAAQYSVQGGYAQYAGAPQAYGGQPAPGGYGGYGPPPQGYGGYGPPQGYGGYGHPGYMAAQPAYQQGAYGSYQQPGAMPDQSSYGQAYAQPAPVAEQGNTWQALQDGEGRTYYYNSVNGVSQWEKPEGMP